MCGRFSNTAKRDSYEREFKVGKLNPAIYKARYNIAPSQMIGALATLSFEILENPE